MERLGSKFYFSKNGLIEKGRLTSNVDNKVQQYDYLKLKSK
jgi:hypothetical protein